MGAFDVAIAPELLPFGEALMNLSRFFISKASRCRLTDSVVGKAVIEPLVVDDKGMLESIRDEF